MKNQDQIIQEEMRKLIKRSCVSKAKKDHYYSFQKALLKFFFGAADVSIDYEKETISLWTSRISIPVSEKLYDLKDLLSVQISYSSLEETLKGCLEKGNRQTRFYQTILFHYNHVNEALTADSMSA